MPLHRMLFLLGTLVCLSPGLARTADSVAELSTKALTECRLGRQATSRDVRLAHFARGQALAERALALDDQYADAHFALFCSLGEQLRIDGERLTALLSLWHVLGELDRTLELNPEHLEAMSSKGTFLIRLPAVLGGDRVKGEQMLRTVLERDAKAVNAWLALAKLHADRGDHEGALALATEAVRIAEAERREDLIPEARATLSALRGARGGAFVASPDRSRFLGESQASPCSRPPLDRPDSPLSPNLK
ncbi:hypothetical protein [Nitrospira sp. Kam-Ns4a]